MSITSKEKMNNYEWLKSQSLIDLAHELCYLMETKDGCDGCPVKDRCHFMCNGFRDWLEDKHGEK